MTLEQLREVKDVVGDMRFIQAAALVASGLQENKQAAAYMQKLGKLDRLISQEIDKELMRKPNELE